MTIVILSSYPLAMVVMAVMVMMFVVRHMTMTTVMSGCHRCCSFAVMAMMMRESTSLLTF